MAFRVETVMLGDPSGAPVRSYPETVYLSQSVSLAGKHLSLMKLTDGCSDAPTATDRACALVSHRDDFIVLRAVAPPDDPDAPHHGAPDDGLSTMLGGLSLASFGGALACGLECSGSKEAPVLAMVGLGLLFGLVYGVRKGAHD